MGQLVQQLRDFGGVWLAHCKHNGFAKLAADGVAQAMFEQGFAEQAVGGLREKPLFKALLLEALLAGLVTLGRFVDDHGGIALI